MKPYIVAALALLLAVPAQAKKPSFSCNAASVSRYVSVRGFDIAGSSIQGGLDFSIPVENSSINASFWSSCGHKKNETAIQKPTEVDFDIFYAGENGPIFYKVGTGRYFFPAFNHETAEFYGKIGRSNLFGRKVPVNVSLEMYQDLMHGGSGASLKAETKTPKIPIVNNPLDLGCSLGWNDRYNKKLTGISNIVLDASLPIFDNDYFSVSVNARDVLPLREDFRHAFSVGPAFSVKF